MQHLFFACDSDVELDRPIGDGEAAQLLDYKRETLATLRSQGKGPRYIKSGRRVFYTKRLLREYLESCLITPEPASVRRQRKALAAEAAQSSP